MSETLSNYLYLAILKETFEQTDEETGAWRYRQTDDNHR